MISPAIIRIKGTENDQSLYYAVYGRRVKAHTINTLWPGQNGGHFVGDIFNVISLHENCFIKIRIPVRCVPIVQLTL